MSEVIDRKHASNIGHAIDAAVLAAKGVADATHYGKEKIVWRLSKKLAWSPEDLIWAVDLIDAIERGGLVADKFNASSSLDDFATETEFRRYAAEVKRLADTLPWKGKLHEAHKRD